MSLSLHEQARNNLTEIARQLRVNGLFETAEDVERIRDLKYPDSMPTKWVRGTRPQNQAFEYGRGSDGKWWRRTSNTPPREASWASDEYITALYALIP